MFSVYPMNWMTMNERSIDKRDGDRHEERVPESQESHQHHDHQDQTGEDVVLELRYGVADVLRHVADDGHPGARRKSALADLPAPSLTASATSTMLAPVRFSTVSVTDGLTIEPRARRFVLEAIDDMGHVLDVDRLAVTDLDDEVFDLAGIVDLRRQTDEILETADVDVATGDVQVLPSHGDDQVG